MATTVSLLIINASRARRRLYGEREEKNCMVLCNNGKMSGLDATRHSPSTVNRVQAIICDSTPMHDRRVLFLALDLPVS